MNDWNMKIYELHITYYFTASLGLYPQLAKNFDNNVFSYEG